MLEAWQGRIREECLSCWAGGCIPDGIVLRVTHYCETALGDLDNLLKPIQDALQGVVYANDRQIRDVVVNRRDINGSYRVRFMSPRLAAAFCNGSQFIHIRLWKSPDQEDLG